jgi:hypothetical protein
MTTGSSAPHFVKVVAGKLNEEQYQQMVAGGAPVTRSGRVYFSAFSHISPSEVVEWAEGTVQLASVVEKATEKCQEKQQAETKMLPGFGGGGWLVGKEVNDVKDSGTAQVLPGFGGGDWLLGSPDASAAAATRAEPEDWQSIAQEPGSSTADQGPRAGEGGWGGGGVSLEGSRSSLRRAADGQTDGADGIADQIECRLTMPTGGHWLVWVTVAGANIAGSPFLFRLSPPPIEGGTLAAAADPDARRAAQHQRLAEARRRKMQAKRMARRQENEERLKDEDEARRRRQQRQTATAQRAAEALRRHREAEAAAEVERAADEERLGMRMKARQGGGYNLEYLAALNQGETLFQSGR